MHWGRRTSAAEAIDSLVQFPGEIVEPMTLEDDQRQHRRDERDIDNVGHVSSVQNPPAEIQKLSFQVPPGGMLCNSLYTPECARLKAFVIAAMGSKQMNSRAAGA